MDINQSLSNRSAFSLLGITQQKQRLVLAQGRRPTLSPPDRIFAQVFAATEDEEFAAAKAGYSHPAKAGSRAIARPMVQAEVKRIQSERLTNDLLPAAISFLERVLGNEKETTRNRLAAAKMVLDRTLGAPGAAGEGKEPHEMSADELTSRIEALRRRQASLAAGIEDAEPVDVAAGSGVFD